MRKIDSIGLKKCRYQAAIFEKSIEKTACSSKIFIRRFMNSELAKRMDNAGFMFESLDIVDAINEVEKQYGPSSYGADKYATEEMYWIGYIYRYWSYVTEKTSKQLYKIIKPERLQKLYFPYHSLDPMQAIERIMEESESKGKSGLSDIEKGVIILRKMRNR